MVAGSRRRSTEALLPIPHSKENSLRVAGIYGANASGKSNVLLALEFVRSAVSLSHALWQPASGVPIAQFRGQQADVESEFVLDFALEGARYQFGFACTRERITREWLERITGGKPQLLYSRNRETMRFGRSLRGENKQIAKLMRPNSLFLSVAAQNNHRPLGLVYGWFQSNLAFVSDKTQNGCIETIALCHHEGIRSEILPMLTSADVGVVAVESGVGVFDNSQARIMSALAEAVKERLGLSSSDVPVPKEHITLKLVHHLGGKDIPFELEDESSGTIAFVALVGPMARMLKNGGTLLVDDLDAGLHPAMAAHILNIFADRATNPRGAQLVFNTHDATLLNSGLLERDQIWFTEKDKSGESHLYPLTDFRPRPDENFERGYLMGRYGAIPYLGLMPFVEEASR